MEQIGAPPVAREIGTYSDPHIVIWQSSSDEKRFIFSCRAECRFLNTHELSFYEEWSTIEYATCRVNACDAIIVTRCVVWPLTFYSNHIQYVTHCKVIHVFSFPGSVSPFHYLHNAGPGSIFERNFRCGFPLALFSSKPSINKQATEKIVVF